MTKEKVDLVKRVMVQHRLSEKWPYVKCICGERWEEDHLPTKIIDSIQDHGGGG